ncbi:MAG TPA: hypothetical protein VGP68_14625 [Gemmataceae bacterium]|nr:hypothetical protein [Gemmataceae bacterium]
MNFAIAECHYEGPKLHFVEMKASHERHQQMAKLVNESMDVKQTNCRPGQDYSSQWTSTFSGSDHLPSYEHPGDCTWDGNRQEIRSDRLLIMGGQPFDKQAWLLPLHSGKFAVIRHEIAFPGIRMH